VSDFDGSHYVRSFGSDLLAEFEDGESLGVVHATMVRPFSQVGDPAKIDNGEFWGLVEFSVDLSKSARTRLLRGEFVRLRPDPRDLPVPSFVVQPVRDVRGDRPRWLAIEVRV